MNVGIIHYVWPPIMPYTAMLAEGFADKGDIVHYFAFIDPCRNGFADDIKRSNIIVHRYYPNQNIFVRLFIKIVENILNSKPFRKTSLRFFWNDRLHWNNFYAVKKWIKKHRPMLDFCIGVEKGGIACAHEMWKLSGVPYFYFSLELYLESDDYEYAPAIMMFLEQERQAHAAASGVLVQDERRGNILYDANRVAKEKVPMCLFPISMRKPNAYWQQDITKNEKTKRLLIFGNNRITDREFVDLAQSLPEDYIIFFHNKGDFQMQFLVERYMLNHVVVSTSMLNEEKIFMLIDGARIGLCWYAETLENNRFTAFASEKLARYLAQGVPVIANAKTNFSELFSQYACGVAVNVVADIPKAIQKIEENYEGYVQQALSAFDNIYDFDKNFIAVDSFILDSLKKNR